MKDCHFTDVMLDTAFIILAQAGCKTEYDETLLNCVCEVCKREGISVRKFMSIVSEVDTKIKELNEKI